MNRYMVYFKERRVFEFTDRAGPLTSTALFDKQATGRFISGHEIDPTHGIPIGKALRSTSNVDEFITTLRKTYKVIQIDENGSPI